MSPTKSRGTVFVTSLVNQIEDRGVECFKNCLLQTNQFSTRYVLTKVLKNHNDHVKQLMTEMNDFKDAVINEKYIVDIKDRDIPGTIIKEYDLNNLNFIEATEIAIQLTEQYIGLYQSINSEDASSEVKLLMERLLVLKYDYLENLKEEYKRLKEGILE